MASTCPSSVHSSDCVRRLSGERKPSSPTSRPGGSSIPNSVTRNFPVTVKNISLARSPLRNSTSPLPYLRRVMIALRREPRSLHEFEHLTEAENVDGQQQKI